MNQSDCIRIAVVGAAFLGLAIPVGAAYDIIDLGTIDGGSSQAYALNNAGQVAGRSKPEVGIAQGFFWSQGTMTGFGDAINWARGINDSGQVVGNTYLWESGAFVDLGIGDGIASAINNSGLVVGWSATLNPEGMSGFVWNNGTVTTLLTPGDKPSWGYALNELGHVAGNYYTMDVPHRSHAAVWIDGEITDLGTLEGGVSSFAFGINDSGQVVGNSMKGGSSGRGAFLYENGVMRDLGSLGGSALAFAINNAGQVVGRSMDSMGAYRAFLWQNDELIDLNELLPPGSGWVLREAMDINEHGWITGSGVAPNGETRAFLLVPEPVALSLLGIGGLVLLRRTQCR
ncbi:MAG: DUF3466 family protein [Phycisphaerae bacterium]|nr:DUF3466 family protein [Phycisphaerae bacterium]